MSSSLMVQKMHDTAPLVQCITNHVVSNFTANILLASGVSPAMADVHPEAEMFATIANGVLINLGTPGKTQQESIVTTAASANENGTPWVLDPVAVGVLPVRTKLAHDVLAYKPTLIRGNASEILALAGFESQGKGVDAHDEVSSAVEAAQKLSKEHGSIVAVSGEVDHIVSGNQLITVHQGTEMLTKVTGGGCALGAVYAAFLGAAGADALEAVVAGTCFYTIAAERAAARTQGPGSFAVAFLDELSAMKAEDIADAVVKRQTFSESK